MKHLIVFLAVGFCVPALATEKYTPGPDNKAVVKGVATLSVAWIKDKGKKFDVHVNIHNDNQDKGMIIFLSDMTCQRGNMGGTLKHTFFNTGERTINFHPNETKEFNLVCNIGDESKGDFKILVSKIYENPSMDGRTVGKVIGKDIVWKQDDRRE